MTNNKMLKLLVNLEELTKEGNAAKALQIIEKEKEALQVEIYNEAKGFKGSEKKRVKAAIKYLKKAKDRNENIGYAAIEGEYQTLCNGFSAIALKDHIEILETGKRFEVMQMFNEHPMIEAKLDLDDLLKKRKAKALELTTTYTPYPLGKITSNGNEIYFNADMVAEIVDILNSTELLVEVTNGSNANIQPIHFTNTITGDKALLLPVRKNI